MDPHVCIHSISYPLTHMRAKFKLDLIEQSSHSVLIFIMTISYIIVYGQYKHACVA